MQKHYLIAISIISGFALLSLAPLVESYIPPTPAIKTITSNDTTYTTTGGYFIADNYGDQLWLISDGSILIEFINYTGGVQ